MESQNTGLPIFLLTSNHPEKFFEKAAYQYPTQAVTNIDKLKIISILTQPRITLIAANFI